MLPFGKGPVCDKCGPGLSFSTEQICLKCGKLLREKGASFCADCQRTFHEFEQNRSLLCYDAVTRPAIYRLKYGNRRAYARIFAGMAYSQYKDWIAELNPDLIIPVPLHRSRMRKRGYNQAALFGAALAHLAQIPFDSRLVIRVKKTVPQKELTRPEREKNLKKAFKIRQNDVKLDTALLIDDIYTTGSTMDAAAESLMAAGVARVYGLTLSIGRNT